MYGPEIIQHCPTYIKKAVYRNVFYRLPMQILSRFQYTKIPNTTLYLGTYLLNLYIFMNIIYTYITIRLI